METVKVAVLGCGRIGKLHGTNLVQSVPQAEVVAVADPFMNDGIKEWAAGLGIPKVLEDPIEAINLPEVQAILICSATPTHVELIEAAAKAGKHVFCEKPLHTDVKKIKECIKLCEDAGVKLQVGFVRRFDHNHSKVQQVVASGRLGKPAIVKVSSRDPEDPPMAYVEVSGGIHVDMTIHDFDMVRYLSGSDAEEVYAIGMCLNPEFAKYDDVDNTIITIKFKNGAIGVIDNTRSSCYGYDQRTEVQCEKGCVQVSNDLENTAMISSAEGVEVAKPTWFFLERYNDAFIEEDTQFCKVVLGEQEIPVTGNDGLQPVLMARAAKLSLQENRPVKLSEVDE